MPAGETRAEVELTWLGQAGVRLRAASGSVVLIDPWFSDHEARTYPPPPLDCIGPRLDLLLATHEHADHLDLDALPRVVARHPTVRAVVPAPLVASTRETCPGIAVAGLQPGDRVVFGDVAVHAMPARHAVAMVDGYTDSAHAPPGQARFVGYVVEIGGVRIYHGGDTLSSDSIVAALRPLHVDIAVLPINGRDSEREAAGIVGNMTAVEAVHLAESIGAGVLVPMHHDAVRGNTERAGAAADAATGGHVHVLNLARHQPLWIAPSRTD